MLQNSRVSDYGGGVTFWSVPVQVGEKTSAGNVICIVHMGGAGATASAKGPVEANARLIAAAPELLEALKEGRRAIGDHFAPNDCYATGPMTGDPIRDLVQCPACSFIAMYESAVAKATGEQSR